MADILGAIANPQMADIAGALDYRQKKLDDDEARRKEIRTNQLVGKALSTGLQPGSVLHTLALENPKGYLAFSKSIGADPSDGAGVNQMTVDANIINKMANAGDIGGALNYVQSEIARRKELGLNTKYLEDGMKMAQENPHAFFNAVEMLDNSFNPPKESEGYTLSENQRRFNSRNEVVAEGPAKSQSVDGTDSTANQKNWEEYQRLIASGDTAGAEQFGRSAGFVSAEGVKLSPFAEKQISEANDDYSSSSGAIGRYKSLAQKLRGESKNIKSGAAGTWSEYLKEQTGNQDELTALRKEAASIVNSEAINNLPPGPATDRDIELARAPFPTEKADPTYVANWLDAISRLNEKKAQYAEFKANFIAQHGTVRDKKGKSMVSAWKDYQKELGGGGEGSGTPGITEKTTPDLTGGWSIKPVKQ
jgi:hypothetical protein